MDQIIEEFTVGNDRILDLKLARYDVLGSLAHAKMLCSVNLLNHSELKQIKEVLHEVIAEIDDGRFAIETEHEDIHSKIESELVRRLGSVGKKIHTARSRNDQILVDLCLYTRDELRGLKNLTNKLFIRLIGLSEEHKDKLMPGYTHMQIAMPSSAGMFFGGFAEAFVDDITMLNGAYRIADQNPLGSAAGYGSSFPIDRLFTTKELNFSTLKYNSIAAHLLRGKLERTVSYTMAGIAETLGRLANDICQYTGQNFGFFSFPDKITTGSSIMPHKKNPDVWELIRGRCNRVRSLPNELALTTTNLPGGYHRDYQILKESFIHGVEDLKSCLKIAEYSLGYIDVKNDILEDPVYNHIFSVEVVNDKVAAGMAFRDAYNEVSEEIENGTFKPDKKLDHTHIGSLGNLCNEQIQVKMEKAMKGWG